MACGGASSLVTIAASAANASGTYVYDLDDGQFLRLSDANSNFDMGGPAPNGKLLQDSPDNNRQGTTQRLDQILD